MLLDEIRKIKEKISVVSIIGPARTGKSYFLNKMIGKNAFKIGNSTNPCTTGLWVYSSYFDRGNRTNESNSKGNEQTEDFITFYADTEGLYAYNRNEEVDTILMLLTCLLSSTMIYNSFGAIEESQIEKFDFLLNYVDLFNKMNENKLVQMPKFVWLLRDFMLDLTKTNSNAELNSQEYLEYALLGKEQMNITGGKGLDKGNEVRRNFKRFFPQRFCFTLKRPVFEEVGFKNNEERLRPEFISELSKVQDFVGAIKEAKTIGSLKMNGEQFAEYLQFISAAINERNFPKILGVDVI